MSVSRDHREMHKVALFQIQTSFVDDIHAPPGTVTIHGVLLLKKDESGGRKGGALGVSR